jgi:hypothetical protein
MPSTCLLPISLIALIVLSFGSQPLMAQHLDMEQTREFEKRQDSLAGSSYKIVFAEEPEDRFRSDSLFIRTLVRALKRPYSFYFPFDSIQTISKLYAPDSSFRIFTWQLKRDEFTYFQRGAIQINTPDGSLKLFGLHDVSSFINNPLDSVRTPNNWIGAIYYRIILKTWQGKKYYTLLGYDDNSASSTKKWMEVLRFNERGEPLFGGPFFSFREDSVKDKNPPSDRFNIEYKKEATTTFNYNPEMDMIVYDQLMPENNEPDKKDTYIPNGEYEGFRWKGGQWVHVDKVFTLQLKDGQFPQEQKILNDAGKPDEQKLLEQSEKNKQRGAKPDSTAPVKKAGTGLMDYIPPSP